MSDDVIATCTEIEDEVYRVLTKKFQWHAAYAQTALDTVLARAVRVRLRGTVQVCRDPNDDMFVECALRSQANCWSLETRTCSF